MFIVVWHPTLSFLFCYLLQAHDPLETPPRRRVFPLTPTFLVLIVKYKMVQLKRKKDEMESETKVVKKLNWKAPNSHRTDTGSSIEFVSLFYPIYDGWQFRPAPPLFNQPSHALAWSISRFKKDGLSHI